MDLKYWILTITTIIALANAHGHPRTKRLAAECTEYCDYTTPDGTRDSCPATPANTPSNRVNTTANLNALRQVMRDTTLTGGQVINAYLVYEGSYYGGGVTEHDQRMQWISGFSGSSGHVIVTVGSNGEPDRAALWSDGRYWLQADQEMDCNWILMKEGSGWTTPSSPAWLLDILPNGTRVGADPSFMDTTTWQEFETAFAEHSKDIQMVEVIPDLFDHIWTESNGRPPIKKNPIYEHTMNFAGKEWTAKLNDTRVAINGKADVLIVTLLDDIAWLFNLRGSDRSTSPLFDSIATVEQNSVRLYIRDPTTERISDIKDHLNTGADGQCTGDTKLCVEIHNYDDYINDIKTYNADSNINKIWINIGVTYAIYKAAGNPNVDKRFEDYSPMQLPKSQKNEVEVTNYRAAQIRDSVIVAEFVSILEKGVQAGERWTELSADALLTNMRSQDVNFKMVSFLTIAAFGQNGAVIHYRPSNATDTVITDQSLFLLDSGGNFLDATTDITRTFHFGVPTAEHIEAYTLVLLGVIDLATTIWPFGLKGSDIDARTRTPIWQQGLNFNHGTGHGIGFFLNVHEGPGRIGTGYSASRKPLAEHQMYSDEPGIYLDGKFGVRLETIVEVVKANTPNNFNEVDYLTFDPVTFVPFEPHLIDYSKLETHHRVWLNAYNKKCNETTGADLLQQGTKQEAYDWLVARTQLIPEVPNWGYDAAVGASSTVTPLPWLTVLLLSLTKKFA